MIAIAATVLVLGGAGLPPPNGEVLFVDPAALPPLTCVLHTEGVAGPGVVLVAQRGAGGS